MASWHPTDRQVIGMISRDRAVSGYWHGLLNGMNPSRADFALGCKLAFFCQKDLAQMDRIFRQSGLLRAKHDSRRGSVTYLTSTPRRCIRAQKVVWTPSTKPEPIQAAAIGRPLSESTRAVLTYAQQHPDASPGAIAPALGMKKDTVKKILRRHFRLASTTLEVAA